MIDMEKMYEMAKAVDYHIRKLESCSEDLRAIKNCLEQIIHSHNQQLLEELRQLKEELADAKMGAPTNDPYERDLDKVRKMLDEENWPEAAPLEAICDTEEKEKRRASAVLDVLLTESLRNKSFLDFGCGAGYSIAEAKRRGAKTAIGYEIASDKIKCADVTDNMETVKGLAPFDIILMNDVLDHCTSPETVLASVRSLVSKHGRVYVRNHPWCSRHGGHLYLQKNKAFLHLIMDEVELTRLGDIKPEQPILKVFKPLETYRSWFDKGGFIIKSEIPIQTKVEPFFLNAGPINKRLNQHWSSQAEMIPNLEISAVEYVLEPLKHQIF